MGEKYKERCIGVLAAVFFALSIVVAVNSPHGEDFGVLPWATQVGTIGFFILSFMLGVIAIFWGAP